MRETALRMAVGRDDRVAHDLHASSGAVVGPGLSLKETGSLWTLLSKVDGTSKSFTSVLLR